MHMGEVRIMHMGILLFYFLYFNSKLHVISVISHVMFENIPPAQHPVLQQDASSLLLVYFLVSIKPLIRVSGLVPVNGVYYLSVV